MSLNKLKEDQSSSVCPNCGSHRVGQVGSKQFFCWSCLVEYNTRREVFTVTEEGTLVAHTAVGGENSVV